MLKNIQRILTTCIRSNELKHDLYFGLNSKKVYRKPQIKIRSTLYRLGLIEYDSIDFKKDVSNKNDLYNKVSNRLTSVRGFGNSHMINMLMYFDTINFCAEQMSDRFSLPYEFLKGVYDINVITRDFKKTYSGPNAIREFLSDAIHEFQLQTISEIDFTAYKDETKEHYLLLTSKSSGFNYKFSKECYTSSAYKKLQHDMFMPAYLIHFFWTATNSGEL